MTHREVDGLRVLHATLVCARVPMKKHPPPLNIVPIEYSCENHFPLLLLLINSFALRCIDECWGIH